MNNKTRFKFDMLNFVRDWALLIIYHHKRYLAFYDIVDNEGCFIRVTVTYGYGIGTKDRPFELWWSKDPDSEPIGYLTREDVEEFINGEYWKDPESFRNKIN